MVVLLRAGVLRLGWDLIAHWDQLRSGGDLRSGLLLALRCAALVAGVWALVRAAIRRNGRPAELTARRLLAGLAGVLLTAIAVGSLVQLAAELESEDRFAIRSAFRSGLLIAASGWLVAALPAGGAGRRRRVRLVGIVAVNVVAALVALEAVALVFTRARPTRLLWNEQSARSAIQANRFRPGTRYLGFAANSGGYYDDEFFRAGAGDFAVAVVADSFGVGIVPHRHNFTTVAERRLAERLRVPGRVAVHNFGVSSIGLPEYAWLLENEVPATAPTRIVVGLFVGNDISGLESRGQPGFYSLQQLQLFEIARRLWIVGRAPRRSAEGAGRGPPSGGWAALTRVEGTFDEQAFMEIERSTVELANTRSRLIQEHYRSAFGWVSRIHRQAGAKLLVVLIPDEYQVNDELYRALMGAVEDPAAYDRRYPQKRLAGFCGRRGIEVLDLLDPLARAHARRPVYRLRDSHWNARGNQVAGETLAEYLSRPGS